MSKKIVLSSNTSFSLYNFRLGLMRRLKKERFDVFTLAPEDNYSEKLKSEFNFYPIKHLDRKGKNPLKDIKLLFEYLRFYKNLKPDLVINFTIKPNIYSSIACGLLGIKCVSVVTGLGYVYVKGGLLKKLVNSLYRISFSFNIYVIFLNEEDMLTFLKIKLINEEKAVLIKSEGINTEHFKPMNCEKQTQKPVFLMISRLLWDKGVKEFVEAGKILKKKGYEVELWLLSPFDIGNPASVPEEYVRDLEKRGIIKYMGVHQDVRPFIAQADAVVLPSYREGIPRVLLEAASMEKPIITTDTVGCREVCKDRENGFLVKPKDPFSLAEGMIKFLQLSDEKKRKMGKRGRQIVLEEFDEKLIVDRYLAIIHEVINA